MIQAKYLGVFAQLSRFSLAVAVLAISWIAFLPMEEMPGSFYGSDKLLHCLAFFVLAALVDYAFPYAEHILWPVLSLAVYGLFIEVVQFTLPLRQFSLIDVLADLLGVVLYFSLAGSLSLRPDPSK